MTNPSVPTRLFLDWHDAAQWVAAGLVLVLIVFAGLQWLRASARPRASGWLRGGSLRTAIGSGVFLVGVVPTVALVILLSERSAHLRHERMEARIGEMAIAVARSVDRFADKHVSGITSLASTINAAGDFSGESIQRSLLRYHEIYGDFLTMLGTDGRGNIVAASSALGGRVESFDDLEGFNVSDRDYFVAPMANGAPFVSQAFRGRGFGADPIVAVSAVLRDAGGRRVGVVEGSLNLRAFETINREQPHIDGASVILVDDNDRVIYSSDGTGFAFLDELVDDPLILASRSWSQHRSFTFDDDSTERPSQYMAAFAPTALGWRVFVRVSTEPIVQQMVGDYRVGMLLLLLTAIISLLLATAFMRRVRSALSALNTAINGFTLDGRDEAVTIPDGAPEEFQPLFSLMKTRSRNLQRAYRRLNNSIKAGEKLRKKLTRMIAQKEAEIAERTAELELANEQLNSQSRRDPLTEIANRREFDAFQKRVWLLGARECIPVAVILIDIDHFKTYNDALGHQAGDEALKKVAKTLESCAKRPLDLVARYGGEEFVAVLGGAAVADALIVAENMRTAVSNLGIPHPESESGIVSVSIGTAAVIPQTGEDAESLIRTADVALYSAKKAGRDRVVFRRDDEFITYDPQEHSLDSTNVIRMIAGDRHRKAKQPSS